MKQVDPAGRPVARARRPLVCRTSDREFDFGAPLLSDDTLSWRGQHARSIEDEHGLRFDVYRSMGLV